MKLLKKISHAIATTALVVANELRVVTHDMGAMIFFFGLPLLYPIVYTLIYNPEVVEKVSVAVVDDSRSAESRRLVRDASACPGIEIYDYAANMQEAREWMNSRDVFGIMHIPSDYARLVESGQQATVPFYTNMALLLRYRTLLSSMTDLQIKLATDLADEKVNAIGAESLRIQLPVNSHANYLGDNEQGFASFVIPGIIILIIQQSMLLGIALIEGSSNERRRLNAGRDPKMIWWASSVQTVLGKAVAYTLLYIPITLYVLRFIPWMFHLPAYGDATQYLLFIFPMLLATAMLGQALTPLMRERENSFMILVVTSVLFLFLSGLTWPRYAMSGAWTALGDMIPGVWGIEGFIRINSNAATLGENAHPYTMLWILTAGYFIIAVLMRRFCHPRAKTIDPVKRPSVE